MRGARPAAHEYEHCSHAGTRPAATDTGTDTPTPTPRRVTPSEFLGDHIFTKSGGFAYKHASDQWPEDALKIFGILMAGAQKALRAASYVAAIELFADAANALKWPEETDSSDEYD